MLEAWVFKTQNGYRRQSVKLQIGRGASWSRDMLTGVDRATTMESKKFYLNPNAPVFVPSNLASSQGKSISLESDPAYQEAKGVARSLHNDAESDDLSQVTGEIREFMEDPFPRGINEQSKVGPDDTVASDLRSLSLMFPGYSEESVLDVYAANDGDIDAAMEMLAQLEGVGDKSMSWPADGSKSCSSTDPSISGH